MKQFEVAVVGAGMVGATCALALRHHGFSVALVDRSQPRPYQEDKLDLRVSAINLASEKIFRNLGAWRYMEKNRITPFREMYVWNQSGKVHYNSAYAGLPGLGHIIENSLIQEALLNRFVALDEDAYYCPDQINDINIGPSHVQLQLESGPLQAKLLVAADGANSPIRQRLNIPVKQWDYGQYAVVANVECQQHHRYTAWQRFLPSGPLAFLPMNNQTCTIVWSTTPDHAAQLCELSETEFCQQLSEAFEFTLGKVISSGPRARFPLRGQLTQHYILNRLALVGDAAHTIHPLAGQGANIGFMDAACLVETLKTARDKGKDFSSYRNLRPYERWRSGDNWLMLNAMSAFKHLFSNDNPILDFGRNWGLNFTDAIMPLKIKIMHQASGARGNIPPLAQNQIT